MSRREDLFEAIRTIPEGRVASYGEAGSYVSPPVSGLVAGKWLSQCPPGSDIPWWRVVGSDGTLKIARKSPELAQLQEEKLAQEGIHLEEGRVPASFFLWDRV